MRLYQKTFLAAAVVTAYAPAIFASDLRDGANQARPKNDDGTNPGPSSISTAFGDIANVLMFLVGAIAVIAIIYGGFLYVTSTGDAKRVEAAKNTILYGVIGLVVAIMAYAIVYFVVNQLS